MVDRYHNNRVAFSRNPLTPYQFAEVYYLNRDLRDNLTAEEKVIFGLIRAFAVSFSWQDPTYEVKYVNSPSTEIIVQTAQANWDDEENDNLRKTCKLAAWIIPTAAEYVFRVTGHHYIISDSEMYVKR